MNERPDTSIERLLPSCAKRLEYNIRLRPTGPALTIPLITGIYLAATSTSQACAVCFGAEGDPVVDAAGYAILFLFIFVAAMLAGVIGFFYVMMKRSSEHQNLVNALGYDPET